MASAPSSREYALRRERWWRSRGINITFARYRQLLKEQGGRCAICRKPPKVKALAVDHNHRTGLVRGLLCYSCNRHGLGRRSLLTFRKLVAYLEKYEGGKQTAAEKAVSRAGERDGGSG